MKKYLAILLSIIMTTAVLTSCKQQSEPLPKDSDKPIETAEVTDTDGAESEAEAAETKPSAAYDWAVEPASIEGDIQPVYDEMIGMLSPCDVSFLNNGNAVSIIGFDGKIKTELPEEGFSYCGGCKCITNHFYTVDPYTYEVTENPMGHGGNSFTPYIYDKESGELLSQEMGDFSPANAQRAIVAVCTKRPLTQEEIDFGAYYTDYAYENTDGYGVVIDGALVLQGFDMYVPYSCGVTALRQNGKWGYYDHEGNEIFPCEYDSAAVDGYDFNYVPTAIPYQVSNGVIVLNKDGKWAFADAEGNLLTGFEFEEARPVCDGKAWVKTADGWGVIELDYDYTEDESITEGDNSSCSGFAN